MEQRFPVLTVKNSNVNTFLGMKIRYLKNRRIGINMKGRITEAVQDFGEVFPQVVTSQATRWLSTVGKVSELQGKRPGTFHYIIMILI